MLSSKLLIICPHADDEMFCIGFIKSRDNEFKEIDFLVVDSNEARLKEAKISASINTRAESSDKSS